MAVEEGQGVRGVRVEDMFLPPPLYIFSGHLHSILFLITRNIKAPLVFVFFCSTR